MNNTELIAEARHRAEHRTILPSTVFALADALEAAEQRATDAEKEMHARELHHFEAEEGLAAAQAIIEKARAIPHGPFGPWEDDLCDYEALSRILDGNK